MEDYILVIPRWPWDFDHKATEDVRKPCLSTACIYTHTQTHTWNCGCMSWRNALLVLSCVNGWPEGEVCRHLTLFHNTSGHPWRPNRGDSPKWTCERATGKREHTGVCYTKHPWGRAETKGWGFCYSYLINWVLINWDGLEPAHQSLGFRIWVCVRYQWVICNGQIEAFQTGRCITAWMLHSINNT